MAVMVKNGVKVRTVPQVGKYADLYDNAPEGMVVRVQRETGIFDDILKTFLATKPAGLYQFNNGKWEKL